MRKAAASHEHGGARGWLLHANLVVAFVAAAFVAGTYAWLGQPPDLAFLVLAVAGTFLVYQLDRAWRPGAADRRNQPERLRWVRRHRAYVWGSTAAAGLALLGALGHLRPAPALLAAGVGTLGLLYALPLAPGRRSLRSVAGLKPVWIALAWTLGGVVGPAVQTGTLSGAVAWLALYRGGFVLANGLLADWPDQAGDRREGLHTPAVRLGARRLRLVVAALLGVTLACGAVALRAAGLPPVFAVDLGGPMLLLACLARPLPTSRFFYGFWIDALVAWPGLTALLAAVFG